MQEERALLREINEARASSRNTDRFIEKYTPFIRSEVMRTAPLCEFEEKNDELSIAMFAFYEALMNYDKSKGAFFPLLEHISKTGLSITSDISQKRIRHYHLMRKYMKMRSRLFSI